ncbi:hypothetical protein [Methyloglobulus sp.]|uniref:hypothetical protein n=1 Tax=Methyloglobulus sp. TaxID=2518622 RepID=UPI00398A357A
MKQESFEPVTDAEVLRQAIEMLAIGNVAVHRAQASNRALGIPNYYSIGGHVVSDREIDDKSHRAVQNV